MNPAAIITPADITATILQYVAAIFAIAIAQISIAAQLNHQQGFHNAFEIYTIDVVGVVASACCGFLLHARLMGTRSSLAFHREIALTNDIDDTVAGTNAPGPTINSSLSSDADEREYESQRLGPLTKQNRRSCDNSSIVTDGYDGDEGDEGPIVTSTAGDAAATKKRIGLLRERKCNLLSNDDAHVVALSANKLDRLKLSLSSTPGRRSEIIMSHGSDPPSDDKSGVMKRCYVDDSAREYMLDTTIEPVLAIDNGSTPLQSVEASSISDDDFIALPTESKPPSPPERKAPKIIDATHNNTHSPLVSKAAPMDYILPAVPSTPSPRTSRPLLNSHCGTFLTNLDKNGFWQSLGDKQQQEAKSCNRPSIIEIMSVGGDDPIAQKILAKILVTGHGFGFCPVDSGEAALEELKGRYNEGGKESLPILILMDTTLPGMDGYETTTAIRSLFPDVALPIIMLTASSDVEITTFQRAVEAGANDMVTQPITKHNLMARIGCQLKTLHFWRGQLESRQNEFLLNEILPKNIITKLQQGHTGCIYDELEEVSVIFTDIVSFTNLSAAHPTEEIIHMLDSLFTEFDKLTDKHGLYKVETIGENTLADTPVMS